MSRLHVNNRNYTNYEWFDKESINIKCDIDPLINKLFSKDVIDLSNNVVYSPVRQQKYIPGILILNGKTYGRNNKKLKYKCIPDDMSLPIFLVPHKIVHQHFNKNIKNNFILFAFNNWDHVHPEGQIVEILGCVDNMDAFYEYKLHCYDLINSNKIFNKQTSLSLKNNNSEKIIQNVLQKYDIQDRRTHKIFTIDPILCVDFDDAFGIKRVDNTTSIISIYIANVAMWLEELGLWDDFSHRISTIYLPNKKITMLSTILSDDLCSLQENKDRFTYHIDIEIIENEIKRVYFGLSIINVFKNFRYDEDSLLQNTHYCQLYTAVKSMHVNHKYISVNNSHNMVEYLMLLMNVECAKYLAMHQNGIFRKTLTNHGFNDVIPDILPLDINTFFKNWKKEHAEYALFSNHLNHAFIENAPCYVHITSPIRRLVDLLNSIQLQINLNLNTLHVNAKKFHDKWILDLDYINSTARSIRKIQNECNLLHSLISNQFEEEQYGYIFNKKIQKDNVYQYNVYLHDIKMISKITTTNNLNNYDKHKFKLYLFDERDSLQKKIQLQIM